MDLCVRTYQVSARFPNSEVYGLTAQIRRASVSIPSNIAEGHRRSRSDYARFIAIARGLRSRARYAIGTRAADRLSA
ncbi:MAG: four helix bundle protein [Anaerolineae bacterium]